MFNILTGFTYRGLSPHKFTPMPGVHKVLLLTGIPLRFIPAGEHVVSPPNRIYLTRVILMLTG